MRKNATDGSDNFKVALLIETSRESGRDMLRGILDYSRRYGHWSIHITPGDIRNMSLPDMKSWGGNGIIARVTSIEVAQSIVAAKIPAILVGLDDHWLEGNSPLARFPELKSNSYAIGQMAAEYYLEQKYAYYAFIGEVEDRTWSQVRQNAFLTRLAEAGYACHLYHPPPKEESDWGIEQKRLRAWRRSLPKPVALFTSTDARGRQILEACLVERISVPEQVAVLGVDNDEVMCGISNPPLSSIVMDTKRGAYRAAELLDSIMKHKSRRNEKRKAEKEIVYYEPLHIVSRRSTGVMHIEDPVVSQALRYIAEFAVKGINVADVVRHVVVARRTLEIKFRTILGRSLHDEIKRVKLLQVKMFLLNSQLPIAEIAVLCGFESVSHMKQSFQKEFGKRVSSFRADLETSDQSRNGPK